MSWMDTLEKLRTQNFKKATRKERDQAAREVVNLCSYACTVTAISPIPFSDAVLMLPIQSAMVVTVGHIYGRKVTQADAKDLLVELGTTAGLGMLARQGIKVLLPMVGPLLTLPAAFAANWAIGRVAIEYFRAGGGLSKEQLGEIFEKAKKEGAAMFSREAFERFRKGDAGKKKAKAPEKKEKGKPGKKAKARVEEEDDDEDEDEADEEDDLDDDDDSDDDADETDEDAEADEDADEDDEDADDDADDDADEEDDDADDDGGEAPSASGSVAQLVERDLADRVKHHPEVSKEIHGVLHLDVTGAGGGKWTVDFRKKDGHVSSGLSGSPKMIVRCSAADLMALVNREKDPQLAVLTGALVLEPMDLELAQAVGKLFT